MLRMRKERLARGWTQKQVAKEIGTAQCVYQRHEYGEQIPNAKLGNRIARTLGTTSEKLWGY